MSAKLTGDWQPLATIHVNSNGWFHSTSDHVQGQKERITNKQIEREKEFVHQNCTRTKWKENKQTKKIKTTWLHGIRTRLQKLDRSIGVHCRSNQRFWTLKQS